MAKRGKAAPQREPKRPRTEDEDVDDAWAHDAQAMAADDASHLQFLSQARLPDVSAAGAQGRAKERLQAEKRRQRKMLEKEVVPDESDVSTDMEGASESEDDLAEEASDLEEEASDLEEEASDLEEEASDLEEDVSDDLGEEASDQDPLEAAYLAKMERRERRAEAERRALAQMPLPIRTEKGVIERVERPSHSRAVYSDEEEEEPEPAVLPTERSTAAEIAQRCLHPDTAMLAIAEAREEIAQLASRITADPEESQGLLRQLLVFAQRRVSLDGQRVNMHPYIRQLALLSLLAVFVDILPGYRIRALSEAEQRERVSRDVARRREWEQALVGLYREYLECCEADVRDAASPIAPIARRCFCTLLVRAPHFNFRKNLLASVIALLSRRAWTDASQQCFDALVELLRQDRDGEMGLELVMLLYRMIRERHLAVHANVLDVLVHLRLRSELSRHVRQGPMGAPTAAESRRADPRQVRKGLAVHRSKKQAKRDRHVRQIESEMREAEATLDLEEREKRQSETLKLVFALYIRILKTDDVPVPLLASALEGIVHFAHHVSADFFRDLVGVLRSHVASAMEAGDVRHALLCIVTALELQAGQGGALELDLGAFYAALYQLLWPLSMHPNIEATLGEGGLRTHSLSALLFRAMDLALVKAPRHTLHVSLERTAAMLRRLLTAALQWPTTTTLHALQTAHAILARTTAMDTRFEALLDNRDAVHDGTYDAFAEQPDSARVLASGEPCWELLLLCRTHANAQVRATADALLSGR